MVSLSPLAQEKFWFDKATYDLAEKKYYEKLAEQQTNSPSPPKLERKNVETNDTVTKKCFVGFNKDEAGIPEPSEKVWVDKSIYDLAEKAYYEKLDKSRLVTLGKDQEVEEKIVNENLGTVIELVGKGSDLKDGLDNEFKANKNPSFITNQVENNVVSNDFHIILEKDDQKLENTTEVSTEDLFPMKQIEQSFITQTEKTKTLIPTSSPRKKLIPIDDKVLKAELIDPDSKKRLRFDEPQEFKENPKPQKIRLTEEKYLSDSVKEKKKPSDEKKSQDNVAKLQKGVPNSNKKPNTNSSLPKNKSTNVNTIPTFPKMATINGLNPQLDETEKNSQTIQKFDLTVKANELPVIKESLQTTNIDENQTKKETKKNKKNKKRHRDEKGVSQNGNTWNSLAGEVAKARQHIKNSLQCIDDIASITSSNVVIEVNNRINTLEKENLEMKQKVKELTDLLAKFEQRLAIIEKSSPAVAVAGLKPITANQSSQSSKPITANVSSQAAKPSTIDNASQFSKQPCDDDEDDGVDLFASDSEEENTEATKIKEQRLAEYAAKKSKKPALIAKSSIVLDVKPWDDTTDMKLMEHEVRKISADGLLWGASKLVPLAYGIHKLQISCVVEDDKVSVDWLQETIEETIDDYVQSVDIAAFNKI